MATAANAKAFRPEHQTSVASEFYHKEEAHRYTASNELIQKELTNYAISMLFHSFHNYNCKPIFGFLLDLGCGSGLSTKTLRQSRFLRNWVISGMDVSPAMLQHSLNTAAVVAASASCKFPYRSGTFDAIISISMIQWLCYDSKSPEEALFTCFTELYRVLTRNGAAVLQLYPESQDHATLITLAAKKSGFKIQFVMDYPHPKTAGKKWFLLCEKQQQRRIESVACPLAERFSNSTCAATFFTGSEATGARIRKEHVNAAYKVYRLVRKSRSITDWSALHPSAKAALTLLPYEEALVTALESEFESNSIIITLELLLQNQERVCNILHSVFNSLKPSDRYTYRVPTMTIGMTRHTALNVEVCKKLTKIMQNDVGSRGIHHLISKNDDNSLLKAALALQESTVVGIVTGFPTLNSGGVTETDGPLGALMLANVLSKAHKKVYIITDSANKPLFSALCSTTTTKIMHLECASSTTSIAKLQRIKSECQVLVAIERPGVAADGKYYSMTGRDISDNVFPLDTILFNDTTSTVNTTIAIGDGGNEVGMKNVSSLVKKFIRNGSVIASTVPADILLVAGVSNWGAYALVVALSLGISKHDQDELLAEHDRISNVMREFHIKDGVTGLSDYQTVDGFSYETSKNVLNQMLSL